MKYFCTTEAIALYLQKYIVYRKRKIFFGKSGKIEDVMPSITKHIKEKFLLPIAADANMNNFAALDQANVPYTSAVMYRTVSNDFGPDEAFDYDLLLFFSPAGIDSLLKNFPNFNQEELGSRCTDRLQRLHIAI
mgnify:CR=1 FL=1